ncbi:MAG TPA: class II aldolase/adducin family protein [Burkholderiaceae bacterium]|nr:class II aldolase/adducin family protein [Burkholderiaceae bacterium]
MSFSDEEYALRCDLAAVFRAMARLGMAEQIAGHNSVKVPESISGPEPMFLINARGYHFSEITASNLLLCRQDGTVVRGDGELRKVAFHIHAGIHVHNPSAVCVLHTHPHYLTALSLIEGGRMPFAHQNDMFLNSRIAYDDDYQGFALSDEEGKRVAGILGEKTILVMGSHGVTVVGPSIADAFDELYFAERTSMYHFTALSTGQKLRTLSADLDMQHNGPWSDYFDARLHLDSWRRILDKTEPDYKD